MVVDDDLITQNAATVTISSVQSGSASDVIDANKIGNIANGTCVTTTQGNAPYLVIDLNLVADVYAVQVITPSPQGNSSFATMGIPYVLSCSCQQWIL